MTDRVNLFRLLRYCENAHEVICGLSIIVIFEGHIKVSGCPQHMQKRPQREAFTALMLKPEIHSEALMARL